ncbi:MAG TPA: hypothetical protein VGD37_27210 [Kofleriaceae bacterium]|jgi:hypothetical protein
MKNQIRSVLAAALVTAFAGCATGADEPAEGIASANVTAHATNYIVCTNQLALRTCDNPGACDTGIRMTLGARLEVDTVNWTTRIAHFTSSPWGAGYALSSNNGEPYLSRDPQTACN